MMQTITTQGQRTDTQFSIDFLVHAFCIYQFSDICFILRGDRLPKKIEREFYYRHYTPWIG
jgi:hypothetical protein